MTLCVCVCVCLCVFGSACVCVRWGFVRQCTRVSLTASTVAAVRAALQGKGFVYAIEGRAEAIQSAFGVVSKFAGDNHNVLFINDVSTHVLPSLLATVDVGLAIWDPAPAHQYGGLFAWTRDADFDLLSGAGARAPLYWAINNCT